MYISWSIRKLSYFNNCKHNLQERVQKEKKRRLKNLSVQKVRNFSTAVNTSLTLFLRVGKSHIMYAQRPWLGVRGDIASVEKSVWAHISPYSLSVR